MGCAVASVFCPLPCREFAPAGDLLFGPPKSRQKARPDRTARSEAAGALRCSGLEGPRETPSATLRSDSRAESVLEASYARALKTFRCSAVLKGPYPTAAAAAATANSQARNPAATGLFIHPPLSAAEERRASRPRAQRASSADSAQLSDRSVAEGVLRGASTTEHRRAARCEAKGRADRGRLFAFFLVAQKEGRPPGRIPGWASRGKQKQPRQTRQASKT